MNTLLLFSFCQEDNHPLLAIPEPNQAPFLSQTTTVQPRFITTAQNVPPFFGAKTTQTLTESYSQSISSKNDANPTYMIPTTYNKIKFTKTEQAVLPGFGLKITPSSTENNDQNTLLKHTTYSTPSTVFTTLRFTKTGQPVHPAFGIKTTATSSENNYHSVPTTSLTTPSTTIPEQFVPSVSEIQKSLTIVNEAWAVTVDQATTMTSSSESVYSSVASVSASDDAITSSSIGTLIKVSTQDIETATTSAPIDEELFGMNEYSENPTATTAPSSFPLLSEVPMQTPRVPFPTTTASGGIEFNGESSPSTTHLCNSLLCMHESPVSLPSSNSVLSESASTPDWLVPYTVTTPRPSARSFMSYPDKSSFSSVSYWEQESVSSGGDDGNEGDSFSGSASGAFPCSSTPTLQTLPESADSEENFFKTVSTVAVTQSVPYHIDTSSYITSSFSGIVGNLGDDSSLVCPTMNQKVNGSCLLLVPSHLIF